MSRAISKSKSFIKLTLNDDKIIWKNDTSGDKVGAIWAYFWLSAAGYKTKSFFDAEKLLIDGKLLPNTIDQDDPRFTAWCGLASQVEKISLTETEKGLIEKNKTLVFFKIFIFKIDQFIFSRC